MTESENVAVSQRLRLARLENKLTLRELANKSGLSHSTINRIEKGLISPTQDTLDLLEESLSYTLKFNQEGMALFYSLSERLYKSILYTDYINASDLAKTMFKHEKEFQAYGCFMDYYLMMFFYVQLSDTSEYSIESYFTKLNAVSDLMTPHQSALYLIALAVYYSRAYKFELAIQALRDQITYAEEPGIIAMNHYIRGFIYAQHYSSYKSALSALDIAKRMFQDQNNFLRVMYIKVLKQALYIYMNRFQAYHELYVDTLHYAQIKGVPKIYHDTLLNHVRYWLAIKDYPKTLEALNKAPKYGPNYMLMRIYTLFQLGINVETMFWIQEAQKKSALNLSLTVKAGILAIEYAIKYGQDEIYVERVKDFCDHAFQQGDYLLIKMAYKLYTKALEDKRRYKDAHIVAKRMLNVMRMIARS